MSARPYVKAPSPRTERKGKESFSQAVWCQSIPPEKPWKSPLVRLEKYSRISRSILYSCWGIGFDFNSQYLDIKGIDTNTGWAQGRMTCKQWSSTPCQQQWMKARRKALPSWGLWTSLQWLLKAETIDDSVEEGMTVGTHHEGSSPLRDGRHLRVFLTVPQGGRKTKNSSFSCAVRQPFVSLETYKKRPQKDSKLWNIKQSNTWGIR